MTPLDDNPAVRAAVSTYVTDQVFTTLDVDQRAQEALPPRAAFLAPPLTGEVRGFVQNTVNTVLASEQFAQLWPAMNRAAHTQIMAVINNDNTVVRSSGDTVTLNLLPVVNEVLKGIEKQAPTLFGKQLNLPTLTNGQIPADLQTKIETALGVTLPASFAAIPIYQGTQLSAAQDAVVQMRQYVGLLVLGSVLALALALLRIGGALVAGVLLLVFTSWTGLLVVVAALVLYELLVTTAAASAPESREETRPSARESTQTKGGTVSSA